MKNNAEKVSTGWLIPSELKESFVSFCAKVGTLAQEDCAGALFVWQYLPPQIREWAKLEAKSESVFDQEFWEGLCAGLEVSLRSLLETQKQNQGRKKSKAS